MEKSIEIIPAILPQDFNEVVEKLARIKGLTKSVQIDICDGHFVPSFTWPYKKQDDNFERIIHEEEGMPGWNDFDFEFDLMIDNPEEVVEDWVKVGASRIIIHAEAKGDIAKALVELSGRVELGLALNIDTPLDVLELHQNKIEFVQCMGIDRVGYQHQPFDEKVLAKIREIKKRFPDLKVSVDGGVSLETAPGLVAAGADRLVAGSAIFNSDNPADMIRKLKALRI